MNKRLFVAIALAVIIIIGVIIIANLPTWAQPIALIGVLAWGFYMNLGE